MHRIASFIFKIMGWKIMDEYPQINKYIIAVAPHTSNIDFFIGLFVATIMRVNVHFLIKKELFFFPIGYLLKAMRAIPVNRKLPKSVIETVVKKVDSTKRFVLVVTPEGTRSPVKKWKKGFYYMAKKSNIPILPAVVDYKKKHIRFGKLLYPSNNENLDYENLIDFYKSHSPTARVPKNFMYPELN